MEGKRARVCGQPGGCTRLLPSLRPEPEAAGRDDLPRIRGADPFWQGYLPFDPGGQKEGSAQGQSHLPQWMPAESEVKILENWEGTLDPQVQSAPQEVVATGELGTAHTSLSPAP